MNYKQLINDIYSFEWNNEYDDIKHWSDISLGYRGSEEDIVTFQGELNIQEKPFYLFLSNSIEDYYGSSFGNICFDIVIENDFIIATNSKDKRRKSIKTKDPKELMLFVNEIFGEKLFEIGKEMDEYGREAGYTEPDNHSFNSYGLPFKIANAVYIHYDFDNQTWKLENKSVFNDDNIDSSVPIFKEIVGYLTEYSENNWTTDLIKDFQNNLDIPWIEKYKVSHIVQKLLLDENYIEDYLDTQEDKCHKRIVNTIFKFK